MCKTQILKISVFCSDNQLVLITFLQKFLPMIFTVYDCSKLTDTYCTWHTYIHVHVHIYVCIYVHVYIRTCTYMYMYIYIYIRMYVDKILLLCVSECCGEFVHLSSELVSREKRVRTEHLYTHACAVYHVIVGTWITLNPLLHYRGYFLIRALLGLLKLSWLQRCTSS